LVWWGCLCSWSIWRPNPPRDEDGSLAIASQWVFSGDDSFRVEAAVRSEDECAGTCKWLLKAIAHSGGPIMINGHSTSVVTSAATGRFILGFIHQLLAFQPIVSRAAVAQTFVQLARQSITEPFPRSVTSTGSFAGHE